MKFPSASLIRWRESGYTCSASHNAWWSEYTNCLRPTLLNFGCREFELDEWIQQAAELVQRTLHNSDEEMSEQLIWLKVKHAFIDASRRAEQRVVRFSVLEKDEMRATDFCDQSRVSPDLLAEEQERHERREKLLSDILIEWGLSTEKRNAWKERECTERFIRSQSHETAATEMRISKSAQEKNVSEGLSNIRKLIQHKDTRQSVFATLFGNRPEHARQAVRTLPRHQQSRELLLKWLVETIGVLCPSEIVLDEFSRGDVSNKAKAYCQYHLSVCERCVAMHERASDQ